MATRSIARLYDSSDHARAAVRDLEAAGFAHDDISYMAGQGATGTDTTTDTTTTRRAGTGAETGAATGATLGTVIGGGAGLLAGLGALAIPGVGPVVAAGWLIATLTGAGAGAA
uniref:general stress protein n=1 Tax=Falsiroseomonas oryzae TaxID=2766473 RepID=UPI0038CBFCDA